jgi:hypothetical protein
MDRSVLPGDCRISSRLRNMTAVTWQAISVAGLTAASTVRQHEAAEQKQQAERQSEDETRRNRCSGGCCGAAVWTDSKSSVVSIIEMDG